MSGQRRGPPDLVVETRALAVIAAVLTVVGIASVYSAASFQPTALTEVSKQLSAAAIGGVLLWAASRLDYHWWARFAGPLLLVVIVLLAVLILPGTEAIAPLRNGARRWIKLGPVTFQPSEVARFALVLWAATTVAAEGFDVRKFRDGIAPVLGVTALVSLVVLLEPNLSMATVLALLGGVVLFVAGAKIGQFMLAGLVAVFGLAAAIQAFPHSFSRVKCFFGIAECNGADWQAGEALLGFASGRWIGLGFGEGQLKLNYVAFAPSDFLFATIGEEFGFAGSVVVILLFALFCWFGFQVARKAPDPFGRFLAAGLTAAIGLSALMHMAVNMQMMPTTGQTLPFMSAGRSSLVVALLMVGVIISVGRRPRLAARRARRPKGRPARRRR